MWKKSGAWFFKGMPKAQEIEAAMQPTKPGAGHKKERRFTVYKPTRVEREEEQAEAEAGVNILSQKYDNQIRAKIAKMPFKCQHFWLHKVVKSSCTSENLFLLSIYKVSF